MMKTLLALLLAVVAFQAPAQVAGLQRCPSIEDPAARLACYDALLPPTTPSPRSAGTQKALAPAVAPVAATAATPPAPAAKQPETDAAFGLPERSRAADVQAIESSTGPGFVEWGPNERIRLENGQVWQVTDGSRGTLRRVPSKVTVTKGLLGAYFMVFEGMNRAPKVQRIE